MSWKSCVVLTLLLLQPLAAEARKKVFAFDWSAPREAEMQYRVEILRVEGKRSQRDTVFRSGTLRVEVDGELLRLHREGKSEDRKWPKTYQEFLDHLPHLAATVEIDRSGEFQLAAMDPETREWSEELVSRLPEDIQEAARRQISPGMLAARWRDLWELEVGLWVGQSFRPGTRFTRMRSVPVPFTEGMMDLELVAEVLSKEPCTSDQRRKRCVRIQVVERANLDSVTDAFTSSQSEAYRGARVTTLERQFTALVEPHTLRPYSYRLHHRLEQVPADEESGLLSEEVTRSWRFTDLRAPGPPSAPGRR